MFLGLTVVGLAFFVQAYDLGGIGVALRSVGAHFHVGIETTQWVVNAVSLGYAIAILIGGRAADLFGAGRVLAAGMACVTIGSLLGAAAPSIGWLITGRAIEGVGVGLAWPAGLSFAYSLVSVERAARVTGIFVAAIAAGNALGPIIGGLLVDALGWRWLLLVEAPPALAVVVLLVLRLDRAVPPGTRADRGVDYAGASLLGAGLLALLVGLTRVGDADRTGILLCAIAAAAFAGFVLVERRAGETALAPPDVLARRGFVLVCVAIFAIAPAFWTSLVYVPLLAERTLGLSAGVTGLAMLPMMGAFFASSLGAGRWYARHGPRRLMGTGALTICAGSVILAGIPAAPSYAQIALGTAALGLGIGMFFPAVTTAAVLLVSPARRGVATGLLYTAEIIGGSIGLAVATALFTQASPPHTSAAVATAEGVRRVFLLVALSAAASAVISTWAVRSDPPAIDGT